MAQYGDRHINIRSRGGQEITLEPEYGAVKLTIGDGIWDHETVGIDRHEAEALGAWRIGWGTASRGADMNNHPSADAWVPGERGVLG